MEYSVRDIDTWIQRVVKHELVELEIDRTKSLMQYRTKNPSSSKEEQRVLISNYNRMFKALLAEKARQELVKQMGNDNSSRPENSSSSPANNAPRSIRIRDILEQEIAGSWHWNRSRRQEECDVERRVHKHESHCGHARLERRRHRRMTRGRHTGHWHHRRRRLRTLRRRQESIQGSRTVHCLCRRDDFTIRILHAILEALPIDLDGFFHNIVDGQPESFVRPVVSVEQQDRKSQSNHKGEKGTCSL